MSRNFHSTSNTTVSTASRRAVSLAMFAVTALIIIAAGGHFDGGGQAYAAPSITPAPTENWAVPVNTPVPVTYSTPRPSATPWNQVGNLVSPAPSPTSDPMIQQSIRENVERASIIDIEPTPPTAKRNRALSVSQAAKSAIGAARPTFRNLEIARLNTQKQITGLREQVNLAITALDTDDRYRVLLDQDELWGEKLEADLKLELKVYKDMEYKELTTDTRRELISIRDMGYERFNFNLTKLDYNTRTLEQRLKYAAYAQYAGIAKMQAGIALTREALTLQEKNLAVTRTKYEIGTASRNELESAELSFEISGIELLKQERSLTSLAVGFNNLIGENTGTAYREFDRSQLKPRGREMPVTMYLSRALEERSEVLSAEEELSLSLRQAELYTTIEISNFNTLDDKEDAEQAVAEAEIEYELTLQRVEKEVRDAYKELTALRGSIPYYEAQVITSRENLERAETLFADGLTTAVSVDQARLALTQAESQLESARIDIWLSQQKLDIISRIGPGGL